MGTDVIANSGHDNFVAVMPDPMELATGLEKREMLAKLAGNDVSWNCFDILLKCPTPE